MIRTAMLAAAALLFAAPATAQSVSQDELQDRYDRALAAGYKALFLCSAIFNAERNGATRSPESVMSWELTGIQQPLDQIVQDLPYETMRDSGGYLLGVSVSWTDDLAPRIADTHAQGGCSVRPIAMSDRDAWLTATGYERDRAEWQSDLSVLAASKVVALEESAFSNEYGADARTTAALVARGDEIIFEHYAEDFGPAVPQRTWSVAKSLAATIVGVAVERGVVEVGQSAGLGVSDDDPRRAVTIDHLLRMASGRYSDTPGNSTDPIYFGGATVDERARTWPLVYAPGSVWRYANNDTLMAIEALPEAERNRIPATMLWLNMPHTAVETDWQGNYVLSSQVWSTARDLARLGQLHLNDGVLPDGTRILPEGWVEYISNPAGPQPGGSRGWGYGAGWWLLNDSEGIPADTFMAAGNRGQYIVVVPSRDIVIVRRGEDPAGGSGFDIEAFARDVLATLD